MTEAQRDKVAALALNTLGSHKYLYASHVEGTIKGILHERGLVADPQDLTLIRDLVTGGLRSLGFAVPENGVPETRYVDRG